MNLSEYTKVFEATFESCRNLGATKGGEYAGTERKTNVHANFDRLSGDLGVAPITILMVYLAKHLDSIRNWASHANKDISPSLSEPVEGRIDDAINYLILLKAMHIRGRVETLDNTKKTWSTGFNRMSDPLPSIPMAPIDVGVFSDIEKAYIRAGQGKRSEPEKTETPERSHQYVDGDVEIIRGTTCVYDARIAAWRTRSDLNSTYGAVGASS